MVLLDTWQGQTQHFPDVLLISEKQPKLISTMYEQNISSRNHSYRQKKKTPWKPCVEVPKNLTKLYQYIYIYIEVLMFHKHVKFDYQTRSDSEVTKKRNGEKNSKKSLPILNLFLSYLPKSKRNLV